MLWQRIRVPKKSPLSSLRRARPTRLHCVTEACSDSAEAFGVSPGPEFRLGGFGCIGIVGVAVEARCLSFRADEMATWISRVCRGRGERA